MEIKQLKEQLSNTAFAFRGYSVTNLGRSPELLEHPMYGPIVHRCLAEASRVCSSVTRRRVDLIGRVRRRAETTLKTYAEAIALVIGMEQAHLELLREFYGIDIREARFSFGYSLGEVMAVAAGGVTSVEDAMRVPIALAKDSAALARGTTLGVLFSRGRTLPMDGVRKLCLEINQEGRGVIGISAHLSPNSLLLMGQRDTLDRFKERMFAVLPKSANLRKNSWRFPPLHTPITWERHIPDRAGWLMHTLPGGLTAPQPPVLSMVTGKASYNDCNARKILRDWVDHPQLLWNVVYETLDQRIGTVLHVGPEPNIIPATYNRLRDNVEAETQGSIGMRALTAVVSHPWIRSLLPDRSALLHAPYVQHVILEDWLLEQQPYGQQRSKPAPEAVRDH